MTAGSLKHRLRFEARSLTSDGYGNVEGDFATVFTRQAQIIPLKGGEAVMAARLTGTQPIIIRVRRDSQTRQIEADWRAVDERTEEVYALKSPPTDMEDRGAYLDILAESGVAA